MSRATKDIVEKWGDDVAKRGFAQVPNYLLLLNQFRDADEQLSPLELLLLTQLVLNWWKVDSYPFPSMKTLAARCGASERQVSRAINRLEKFGLLERVKRRSKGAVASNAYNMKPLVDTLTKLAGRVPNERPRSTA